MQPKTLKLVIGRQSYPLLDVCRIGRDPALQVVLDDPKVSRLHATVWLQDGPPVVRDESSSNGTYVNE